MPSILVVDDKDTVRQMLSKTLQSEGYEVDMAADGATALEKAKEKQYDLVLTDLKLPEKDGLEVLSTMKDLDPDVAVIVMTAYGTIESAVQAMKMGAFDFLTKPFDTDHLNMLIKRALETRRMMAENVLLREELAQSLGFTEIVGKCEKMKEVSKLISKVAPSDTTVLLYGESGTGKELFA